MRIDVSHHVGLGESGISLNCFYVAAANTQFDRCAEMSETVEYNRRQVVLPNKFFKLFCDQAFFDGATIS